MEPLASAMTSLRSALLAAFKSLLKGKSLIQAIVAYWSGRSTLKELDGNPPAICPSEGGRHQYDSSILEFLREAEELLLEPVNSAALSEFSLQLKAQLRERLWSNTACMLPSYNHQLPDGSEHGRYLALDVGGSTLRIALVELDGRPEAGHGGESNILHMSTFKIDSDIKNLVGMDFFDWVAARIVETVSSALEGQHENGSEEPIPVGLAWSFPIEQTSAKGGLLQGMGKGFLAADGLLGQNLGDIIQMACSKRGLNVELAAIVNDSSATLLSGTYRSPLTRFGLILGTGFNISAFLNTSAIDRPKFGARPASWLEKANHVIINTEMGMFGQGILPMTRWDRRLNDSHPKPEFQPLEHFVSGLYLGELARLVLVEAIESTGIFGGIVPPSLLKPYSLETETISAVEGDTTSSLSRAISTFSSRHPSSVAPTTADMVAVKTIASLLTHRSAAIVAAAVYGLWELKAETERECLESLTAAVATATTDSSMQLRDRSRFIEQTKTEMNLGHVMVAYNGSVMEQYPGFLKNCQGYIDGLLASSSSSPSLSGRIELVPAKESSLIGAAVALACREEGKAN
ncbi:hexokinase-1 [Magnaporthiopsis poae ATCC 64411]|uniref:Phosphotransferase n=1 Tax=Magnaporthiopsis poae (strain ATCC 64411 / 73-15) TaxID=644358 RepID=A0A0C4E0D1_MAGP6|nr:hexokinase-1 [Magnaporthiopsis poae ATCC 64411]